VKPVKRVKHNEIMDDDDMDLGARQRVLDILGLITEDELALVYRCGRKAMQNRPRTELPPFFRAGGQRLWFRADVIEFFQKRTND